MIKRVEGGVQGLPGRDRGAGRVTGAADEELNGEFDDLRMSPQAQLQRNDMVQGLGELTLGLGADMCKQSRTVSGINTAARLGGGGLAAVPLRPGQPGCGCGQDGNGRQG